MSNRCKLWNKKQLEILSYLGFDTKYFSVNENYFLKTKALDNSLADQVISEIESELSINEKQFTSNNRTESIALDSSFEGSLEINNEKQYFDDKINTIKVVNTDEEANISPIMGDYISFDGSFTNYENENNSDFIDETVVKQGYQDNQEKKKSPHIFHQIKIDISNSSFDPPQSNELIKTNAMNTIDDPNWDSLRTQITDCEKCTLCVNRTKTVFGQGALDAKVMIVGEAPGKDEDETGLPFVGRSGKLLDLVLKSVGLSRDENVFISNTVKCRPEKNRDPSPAEIQTCRSYLDAQISLIKPKLIICVGRISAQTLLNTKAKIGDLRGNIYHLEQNNTPVIVIYHPAYLLRMPSQKSVVWQDLKKYRKLFT